MRIFPGPKSSIRREPSVFEKTKKTELLWLLQLTHIVFNPRMTIISQNINQKKIYEKYFSLLKYISKKSIFLNITF